MPLACNIDAKGKAIRLVYGLCLLVLGLILVVAWAWGSGSAWAWVLSVGLCLIGAFAIVQARAGWCAIRAMGFKTPV